MICANILLDRLKPYANEIVGEYQCGFRKDRSTIDQVFTIKQIMEKCWEFNKELHQLFVDFKQAYDNVCRVKLWEVMEELGFPKKLIRLTQICINGAKNKVRIGQELSDIFEVNNGLKQGDAISPLLFNISLEYVVRKAEIKAPMTMFRNNGPKLLLAFADDVDVIGSSRLNVKETFTNFEKQALNMGLKINEGKTKYMYTTRNNQRRDRVGQNITMVANEERIRVFERRVLRKIYGPVTDITTGRYRIRKNRELYELYKDPNIINEIKARRLQWAGHVKRLPDNRIAKLAWEEAPEGKRPLGRPRLRWRDNIEKDLKIMEVDNALDLMNDRQQWRRIVKSAKTHPGL
ncbi:uncharacterized protein LOC132697176 [Cylas formicarius]|uniref:uncharacterized protein LOC132697176 n=1 Tax=Cylas formicarius TaxID=197179 RepID=UPI002958AB5B|nr:uncharacterized protein LOC132697176 [Cylas formicarius]